MMRLGFRRKKDDEQREFLQRQYEDGERKRLELEAQLQEQKRQEFIRREREDREKAEAEQRQKAEFYKAEQIENQRQEAETRRLDQLRKTTPEALRQLRDLIRTRYELDVYIWSCRKVQKADQHIVIREGKKADAILQEIHDIVDTWEPSGWSKKEWEVACKIKEGLQNGEQRVWEGNPPWDD